MTLEEALAKAHAEYTQDAPPEEDAVVREEHESIRYSKGFSEIVAVNIETLPRHGGPESIACAVAMGIRFGMRVQRILYADIQGEVKFCSRAYHHDGPCNGLPRKDCPGKRADTVKTDA